MQTVGRQQATAADRVPTGHHPARGVQFEVGVVVHGQTYGVAVHDDRAARQFGDPRVQAFAQPGRQRSDQFCGHLGGDRRKARAHAIFSPTQRASSSGLRAATGMPAATSCPATPVE